MKLKQLYRFTEGDLVWTLTSSDVEETHNGEIYAPVAMGRNDAEVKNELSRSNMEIRLPLDHQLAIRNIRSVVESQVSLTVFAKGDTTDVEWKGRLASVKPGEVEVKLVFESIFTSMRRPGLRKRFQRSCPHVHYGRGCKLDKEAFAVSGDVTNVSGLTVTMPIADAQPDGYYAGGMIEGPDGVLRFITQHVGANLTLIRPLDSLTQVFAANGYGKSYGYAYGDLIARIFPGCDRTKEICKDKFDNLDNHGGYPWIPLKNPVGGSSIV